MLRVAMALFVGLLEHRIEGGGRKRRSPRHHGDRQQRAVSVAQTDDAAGEGFRDALGLAVECLVVSRSRGKATCRAQGARIFRLAVRDRWCRAPRAPTRSPTAPTCRVRIWRSAASRMASTSKRGATTSNPTIATCHLIENDLRRTKLPRSASAAMIPSLRCDIQTKIVVRWARDSPFE